MLKILVALWIRFNMQVLWIVLVFFFILFHFAHPPQNINFRWKITWTKKAEDCSRDGIKCIVTNCVTLLQNVIVSKEFHTFFKQTTFRPLFLSFSLNWTLSIHPFNIYLECRSAYSRFKFRHSVHSSMFQFKRWWAKSHEQLTKVYARRQTKRKRRAIVLIIKKNYS